MLSQYGADEQRVAVRRLDQRNADGEGALQLCSNEGVAEHRLERGHEVLENSIQLTAWRRMLHAAFHSSFSGAGE